MANATQKAIDAVIRTLDLACEDLTPTDYADVLDELIADFEIRSEAAHREAKEEDDDE